MKYRINYGVALNAEGEKVLEGRIQVKGWLLWHTVAIVRDDDAYYVMNRSEEIVSLLENA